MDNQYKWNLKDIFENESELEAAKQEIYNLLKQIEQYKGTLKESASRIYECYNIYEKMLEIYEKFYAYYMFKYHQNMADSKNTEMYKMAEKVGTDISTATSFIVPEITSIDEAKLKEFLNTDTNLARYKRLLEDIIENKKYVLSGEAERILASFSEVFGVSESSYDIFTNTEFEFPKIIDENGEELELTQATYTKYMMSSNQNIRKQAFESMYSLYKKHINTITEMYIARVKENVIKSKLRNYKSSLEKAVKSDDSTIEVYNSLVEVVNEKMYINHEYMNLKKQLLGKDELHIYDIYYNKLRAEEKEIEYAQAKQIVLDALAPMGEEYSNMLKTAFNNNWIDVYEEKNKMSGAYSMGVYGVHPYVLTNFTNQEEDISTIAHELGHAMHSYYSNSNQNVLDANYTIMVAEVASTVNEIILGQYLIKNENDKNRKAALINAELDKLRATLIRQTMFAEFEKIVHEKVEKDEQLTSDKLCDIYLDLNKKYFGENVIVDEDIKYEWARIPHFYSCFYVYKYATGISAAIAIAKKILSNEDGFVEKYINMLKQGCTKKSVDLLKMVDVDLESKKPYEDAFEFYKQNLDELKELIK